MTLTTLRSISDLEGFDVSPVLGFVPLEGLIECLPASHVAVEDLVRRPELPEAMRSFVLREKVAAFPSNLDYTTLTTAQLRRAMVILSFVAHAYIWGNEMATPLDELPRQLAVPLVQIGDLLGIAPLGTYATTVLWNCRLAIPQVGWTKENVMIDFTFTGTEDEELFYNISARIEVEGGRVLTDLLSIALAVKSLPLEGAGEALASIATHFDSMREALKKMTEILSETSKMDTQFFYWHMRPYFAGWELCSKGVHYKGVDAADVFRRYPGISAAQSSLFQALDILFGIEHHSAYLTGVRVHMPHSHSRFLEVLKKTVDDSNLQTFVRDHDDLSHRYNACLDLLKGFRLLHMSRAKKFAVDEASRPDKVPFGLAKTKDTGGGAQGAGGTQLVPFLSGLAKDTADAKIPRTGLDVVSY